MSFTLRPLTLDDAEAVAALYQQSAAYLRALGDDTDFQFSAQVYRRDGFGPQAAFAGLGAVLDEHLVGYLLYNFGYDTDRAMRYLCVLDLLVDEAHRRKGIGQALMQHVAVICRAAGGQELCWAVYAKNEAALRFYHRLGAEEIADLRYMRLAIQKP